MLGSTPSSKLGSSATARPSQQQANRPQHSRSKRHLHSCAVFSSLPRTRSLVSADAKNMILFALSRLFVSCKLQVLWRHGEPQVEALPLLATMRAQEIDVRCALHALGHGGQTQGLRHRDGSLDDGAVARILVDPPDKGAIDFELIDRKVFEISQR